MKEKRKKILQCTTEYTVHGLNSSLDHWSVSRDLYYLETVSGNENKGLSQVASPVTRRPEDACM